MRFMYRQTQEIPFEKWLQELELERKTDEEEARLGHPLPRRYRYYSGANILRREYMNVFMMILRLSEKCLRLGRTTRLVKK